MQRILNENSRPIASLTSVVVTTAAFGKLFVPFYLIGSTAIFAALCLLGALLIAANWRRAFENVSRAGDVLILTLAFYGLVVASYIVNSRHLVPLTDLLGILIFHSMFIAFGFAAASRPKAVFATLLAQAGVYLIFIVQYVVRFGDLMKGGFIQDVFGVGDLALSLAFHQHIGMTLGLASLAALGFQAKPIRLFALAALPFTFAFLFHIGSRTAIVSLASGLFFLAWSALWIRSRKLALTTLFVVTASAAVASMLFVRFALQDTTIGPTTPDVVSRTIQEVQSKDPGFRLPIWDRAWHRIIAEPEHLLLGRGVGMFPIDEGVGAPDWLLRKTEGARHYPHNVQLEVLYEDGAVALLAFSVLIAFPLVVSLKYWERLSMEEGTAISLYVFYLVSVEISGSFSFSYEFQFFLALAIGVVSSRRRRLFRNRASLRQFVPAKEQM